MSRDQSGRSKWSREQAQNSIVSDRFFRGANSLVISVVNTLISDHQIDLLTKESYHQKYMSNTGLKQYSL